MLNQRYQILFPVDSYIEPLLLRVLKTDKLGICCETIEADSISSSCGKNKGDRFKLSIPYAKQTLTWNVFFDSQCPEMGPDFIFNDDTFLADMDVDILSTKVPSLAKWNPDNGDALLNVLVELLACYKEHQIQLLQKEEELQREYSMLMRSKDIRLEDVETILLPLGSKPMEAKFLISFSVDLSQLQNSTCESSDVAILLITYCGVDWNYIIPQLFFKKSVEDILGGTTALQIPCFPPHKFLMDYVPEIKKFVAEKINSLAQSLEKRRNFLATLIALQNGSFIEFDAVYYTNATLLLTKQDFFFIVKIDLPLGFPKEPPRIMLQSVYHMVGSNTIYSEWVENFPYNSQWKPLEMIEKLFNHIVRNVVEDFKHNSIKIDSLTSTSKLSS
ncbi:BRISC and BRCA1-A complex member 2 isoform X1 [Ptiloglossa arizonensis]|uniref:BRISC and BRCA1-A complex member 2 isoform X1 n=1 Tax=Ptiloglossa arizonensis TaxID=3350558 RepID=UPI003F9F018F